MGRQPVILLDTHALVWWATEDPALSTRAKLAIRSAGNDGSLVASTISVFEIATAVRKGRLALGVPLDRWLAALGALPELRFEPVSVDVAYLAGGLENEIPGDPADRMIVATARALGATLITADDRLRRTPGIDTVW